MPATPFRMPSELPEPLTAEETADKFGVSRKIIGDALRLIGIASVRKKARRAKRAAGSAARAPKALHGNARRAAKERSPKARRPKGTVNGKRRSF